MHPDFNSNRLLQLRLERNENKKKLSKIGQDQDKLQITTSEMNGDRSTSLKKWWNEWLTRLYIIRCKQFLAVFIIDLG